MSIDFLYKTSRLTASYRILTKVPADSIPDWDFGDNRGKSKEFNPTYTYEAPGFYNVTLTINGITSTRVVVISDQVDTHLTDSIYNLIDQYIPKELLLGMTLDDKIAYINKWQLYLYALVNHTIPVDEYSNELYYEGLENQLIMELAVYDFLYTKVINLLISTGYTLETQNKGGTEGGRDRVKQITTGPSEVQFFDEITEASSSMLKVYSSAIQPGGILDTIRNNICMLASRLEIFLPICNTTNTVVAPKVVNKRDSGMFGGPNPGSIVNSSTKLLIPE